MAAAVGVVEPALADGDAVDQVESGLTLLVDVARNQREAELLHQAEIGVMDLADDLAPELDHPPVVEHLRLDAPAHAATALDDEHVAAGDEQIPCACEPGEPGTDHDHVGACHVPKIEHRDSLQR